MLPCRAQAKPHGRKQPPSECHQTPRVERRGHQNPASISLSNDAAAAISISRSAKNRFSKDRNRYDSDMQMAIEE
jgi:hypothetical protein